MATKAKKERRGESLSFYLKQYGKNIDVFFHHKLGASFPNPSYNRVYEIDNDVYILNKEIIEPIW